MSQTQHNMPQKRAYLFPICPNQDLDHDIERQGECYRGEDDFEEPRSSDLRRTNRPGSRFERSKGLGPRFIKRLLTGNHGIRANIELNESLPSWSVGYDRNSSSVFAHTPERSCVRFTLNRSTDRKRSPPKTVVMYNTSPSHMSVSRPRNGGISRGMRSTPAMYYASSS